MVTAEHQQMTGEHEPEKNEEGKPLVNTKQGQNEDQRPRQQTAEQHTETMIHCVFHVSSDCESKTAAVVSVFLAEGNLV